jgi:hypothetical protein
VFAISNGRFSFFGSLLERGRPFIRLDPGCMKPLSRDGEAALAAFGSEKNADRLYAHQWNLGAILVLDNWRMLHGRGIGTPTEQGRVLVRAMVK